MRTIVRRWLQVGRSAGSGGRREAGTSDFVRRALLPVMPDRDEFGFTVRLNADALAVDGSAAAASVCSGALALADAAIPASGLVAAVTVGLMEQPEQDEAQGEGCPLAPCGSLWSVLAGFLLSHAADPRASCGYRPQSSVMPCLTIGARSCTWPQVADCRAVSTNAFASLRTLCNVLTCPPLQAPRRRGAASS
jgi:hypothetical protein